MKVILGVGYLLSGLFASRIFSAAIVKETYKLQKYMKTNDDYYNMASFVKEVSNSDSSSCFHDGENIPPKKRKWNLCCRKSTQK